MEIFGYGILGVVVLYLSARLITSAYFKSRADYERRMNNGKR